MATTRPARKTTGRGARRDEKKADRPTAPPPAASDETSPAAGSDLFQAGLKAWGDVQRLRPTRVFETLLGIDPTAQTKPQAVFKIPTFEDLFDERVSRSLDRLGVAQVLADLRKQLESLDKRLRHVERLLEKQGAAKRPKG